ncbi:helix-turn-helix transcriptional regulator [Streptomyces sp. NPDC047046]|uniref:helix-turn-helix domain-containing protein n=1 Tax=Streptomyces sp. NPDC047046 TaxID=3155378 RepID=UPI0033E89F74
MVNRRKLDPGKNPRAAFGARLRVLREERGWTQPELGALMGYAASHISGVETGTRGVTARFSESADRVFGTGDALTRQGDRLRNPSMLRGFDEYIPLEGEATEIRVFELSVLPGIIQTRQYAGAMQSSVIARGAITTQQAEERIARQLARQKALMRVAPPKIFMIIDEGALYHRVGGTEVMAEQYERLLDFAALPNTVLQVAPFSMGEHRALGFPVNLLTLRSGTRVAYTESAQLGHLERESRYVEPLFTAYCHLQVESLSQTASVAVIERVRKETS